MISASDILIEYAELLTLHDRLVSNGDESAANYIHRAALLLEQAHTEAVRHGDDSAVLDPWQAEPIA